MISPVQNLEGGVHNAPNILNINIYNNEHNKVITTPMHDTPKTPRWMNDLPQRRRKSNPIILDNQIWDGQPTLH